MDFTLKQISSKITKAVSISGVIVFEQTESICSEKDCFCISAYLYNIYDRERIEFQHLLGGGEYYYFISMLSYYFLIILFCR